MRNGSDNSVLVNSRAEQVGPRRSHESVGCVGCYTPAPALRPIQDPRNDYKPYRPWSNAKSHVSGRAQRPVARPETAKVPPERARRAEVKRCKRRLTNQQGNFRCSGKPAQKRTAQGFVFKSARNSTPFLTAAHGSKKRMKRLERCCSGISKLANSAAAHSTCGRTCDRTRPGGFSDS